jgi:competence protein ComEC
MAVLPVTGLLTMPAAVAGTLAMPFGFEQGPLWVMGLGIDWMVAVGRWAAAMPGGAGWIGAPHAAAMPLGIVAVLWLSAWKSRIRLLGLVPALAAIAALGLGPRPDVLIGRHGSPIAVRGPDGALAVLGETKDRFDVSIWLAADADPRPVVPAALADGWSCDPTGCVFARPLAGPGLAPDARLEIAVVRHPDAFAEDCRRAALVITPLVAPPGCRERTTVVDRIDLARNGAATIDFTGPLRPMAAAPPVALDRAGHAPSRLEDDPTDDTAGDRVDLDIAPSGPDSADPNGGARSHPDPTASARRSDTGPLPGPAANTTASSQRSDPGAVPGTTTPATAPHPDNPIPTLAAARDANLDEPSDPPTLRREDRKSTRLNSSHNPASRMPSSA